MIRDFENWNTSLGEASSLEDLKGTNVAIDAADYINTRIFGHPRAKEPLVPALGGLPLGLTPHIEEDLQKFASYQINPLFIFPGLDLVKQEDPFRQRREGAQVNAHAWSLYDGHQAEESVAKFGESTYVTSNDLLRPLQSILTAKNIPFQVAPYSSWAQLAYLEKHNHVQAISGPSELLLFDCDKIITYWDLEAGLFKWIRRGRCVAELKKYVNNGELPDATFVDACMLAGSHFLPTLPTLESPNRKQMKPLGAIEMIMSHGRTGIAAVLNNQDDPRFHGKENAEKYADKYRRARLSIKHHPILTVDGKVTPMEEGQMPNDGHEFIGQRLPDEIYHYLAKGLINARIVTWRATSEIIESPPMDGGESPEYRKLVSSKLTPLRTTAINLLSSSLHNWYQHKDLTLKCWFEDASGKPHTSTISMKDLPEYREVVDTWNVKEATFKDVVAQHQPCGYLGAAILSLKNADFVAKTISKKDSAKPLSTTDEILHNSIWRFLALREYVDAKHNLTAWGKVLATAITTLKGVPELEEAAVIAVELVRLGILNSDIEMFPTYNGAPMRGEQKDRNINLLISRVAGLGTLHHRPIGFTGPLSQHLLGYNSMINIVRSTLRDLVEVAATHMFMGASAKRDINNLSAIAMKLPFLLPNNCALSIAVKSYLDELLADSDPTSAEAKARVSETASTRYFPQSENFAGDLKTAFELWDAVFEGVKSSGNLLREQEKKQWNEANEWLAGRR
ncbi:PIN domain-like protein [Pleomassaria siparia CBS 279.74]|uniref:PIN domain-like protein n=1 Tax=Pleomassaria siparia CBS 279.74 TaxID=1314801 RepID=A0A6G1K007_9PLEO|nr:PIN domain-like protein [Pleomassaria siparia CBS 279.74]